MLGNFEAARLLPFWHEFLEFGWHNRCVSTKGHVVVSDAKGLSKG
jgi:hypothetical protein